MRKILLPIAAVALGATAMAGAQMMPQTDDMTPKQTAEFAKLTAGLVPGKPVDCIDTRRADAQLKSYGNKLAYRFSRKRVYVSETAGGCGGVARGDALITHIYTGRLCRGDIARTVDFPAGIETGGCSFGAFTPYTAP